jgi:hypothetical protein
VGPLALAADDRALLHQVHEVSGVFTLRVRQKERVWLARRIDIARHWHERHAPTS